MDNICNTKRRKKVSFASPGASNEHLIDHSGDLSEQTPEASESVGVKPAEVADQAMDVEENETSLSSSMRFLQVGMRISIPTTAFDGDSKGSWSSGKPERTFGIIKSINKNGTAGVLWDGDKKVNSKMNPLLSDLTFAPIKTSVASIMQALEIGSVPSYRPADQSGDWPKNFFDALIKSDWRDWVSAVRKENAGWIDNNTTTEVAVSEVVQGASIIPLGELYIRKRDGTPKFRQYAMGNLLKAGKDYGDTFSTCVSADGLRWFCSLACSTGLEIRGWDATTGYLQAEQRIPVYAFLPSHHKFSNLSFEELAALRNELLSVQKKEGPGGVKRLSAKIKKESRSNPSTVLQLNTAVYGIPDAGQAFAMLMQGVHIKQCEMKQCEVDPSIYSKYELDAEGKTREFLIVITWTDDVRYFGTPKFVSWYENKVKEHIKCTMFGVSKDFVGITIDHQISKGTLELVQPVYWEKAAERFKEYLPKSGPKKRSTPMSIADHTFMVDATDEEVKEAAHLPFPQLLGVIQFPAAFTKLEMRFAVSTLSRFRGRWGMKHFAAALKALEYGFATRSSGLLYTQNRDPLKRNVLIAYADSGFGVPRSQGCRIVMMNGAAISLSSKRHTTTDDSTAAAELTEQFMCSCDVAGLRNLMDEVGLHQELPTVIFQDNKPAIQIAMNRGALAKKTRSMELRTLSVRNKIEDGKVIPIYLRTEDMVADIGTKALEVPRFERLRDLLTGYSVLVLADSCNGST
jgi:hypothetical protein